MEYKNSNGYFKDPGTFEDLSVDTPRVVQCSIDSNGKFIWPQVKVSTGDVVKIVYKLFTVEEKELYKQYRSKDGQRVSNKKKVEVVKEDEEPAEQTEEPVEQVAYSSDCATSENARAIIANCDKLIGVSQIAGLTYALLTCGKSNVVYHVPRRLIKEEDMLRLCNEAG